MNDNRTTAAAAASPAKKIRVLLVAPSMRAVGGQSVQAARLREAFADDPRVALDFVPNDPETAFGGVKYLRTVFASLAFWRRLAARAGRADIVHVFSSGTTSYLISSLPPLVAARAFGRARVLLNYHNGALAEHLEGWPRTAAPTMRRFDRIVVPSDFLIDVFARFGLAAETVYNFVDTREFRFRERERFRPVFLANRNFEAEYRVADTLRAFRLVQDRFPDAALLVAGAGSEESALKSLAAELKLARVEFTGRVTNAEMARLYDRADIYLNSSVVDNMPLSFIEAFACGLPVVSYASGGIPYLVEAGANGMLAAPGNFAELAERAVFLLENQDAAKKIVAKARAEVVKYSLEKVRAQWLELYADLAA